MIVRALVPMLVLGSLALADVSAAPAPAQEANDGPSTGGQTQTAPPAFDPIPARIKYLHDRLRITPEQEPLWDTVAQAIRANAQDAAPLLKERFRTRTSGSALEVLHSYEALGEAQLDGLKKFVAAFDPLYAGLSESQKRIADAILREGPLNTMVGGIPQVPPPFGAPLVYPLFWSGLGVPIFIHRPSGLPHFHGFISPGRHFGGFRRR
jgi:periplasmic protein CpxP/Spy